MSVAAAERKKSADKIPTVSPLADRAVLAILAAGLLIRLLIAAGLHLHFGKISDVALWSGTDEETFYSFGLRSAQLLRDQGWNAFLNSPPSSAYFNWLQFKYTGLVIYAFGDSPLALRLFSVLFATGGLALLIDALGRSLSERRDRILFAALLCLFPSFAFWSALAIKEGILTFFTGALCWGIQRMWQRPTPWPALAWAAAICLLIGGFRIWAGVGYFCIVAVIALSRHPGRPRPAFVLCWIAAFIVGLWFIPQVQLLICRHILLYPAPAETGYAPNLNVHLNLAILEGQRFSPPVKCALAAVLPLPGIGAQSRLAAIGGLENILFLALCFLAAREMWRRRSALESIWAWLGIVILFVAVAVGTNVGTIYRTKVSALPFFAVFAACPAARLLSRLRRSS